MPFNNGISNTPNAEKNQHQPVTSVFRSLRTCNIVVATGLGSIPFFQFNSNSNSFTFNSNSNSFGMKNSNSNSNSFLSIPIPIPIPFYPRPVLAFGYCHRLCLCVCVSLCVNHLLVRVITWDPFQLGSPNLDQRCKRPWLRSLLFWGAIDLDLQGQI